MTNPWDIKNIISPKPLQRMMEDGAEQVREMLGIGSQEHEVDTDDEQMCGYEEVEE